jgi:hypothetical protein
MVAQSKPDISKLLCKYLGGINVAYFLIQDHIGYQILFKKEKITQRT